MNDNQVDVGAIIGSATADTKRPATAADALALAKVWARLNGSRKALREAIGGMEKGLAVYSDGVDTDAFAATLEAAAQDHGKTLIECRQIIAGLPNGVTGPGGRATKQTVVLEFYGAVNRDLGARLSASDAKSINKAAFGR